MGTPDVRGSFGVSNKTSEPENALLPRLRAMFRSADEDYRALVSRRGGGNPPSSRVGSRSAWQCGDSMNESPLRLAYQQQPVDRTFRLLSWHESLKQSKPRRENRPHSTPSSYPSRYLSFSLTFSGDAVAFSFSGAGLGFSAVTGFVPVGLGANRATIRLPSMRAGDSILHES